MQKNWCSSKIDVVYWYYKNLWFHLRNIDSNSGNKIRKSRLVFNPLQTIYFPLPQTVSSPQIFSIESPTSVSGCVMSGAQGVDLSPNSTGVAQHQSVLPDQRRPYICCRFHAKLSTNNTKSPTSGNKPTYWPRSVRRGWAAWRRPVAVECRPPTPRPTALSTLIGGMLQDTATRTHHTIQNFQG